MKCKQGDLVVIARVSRECDRPHIGKIVTVEYLDHDGMWVTEPELPSLDEPGMVVVWYDWELEPLRDNDGADETFAWAGKPEPVRDQTLAPKRQVEHSR